jgi:hypothetical protein
MALVSLHFKQSNKRTSVLHYLRENCNSAHKSKFDGRPVFCATHESAAADGKYRSILKN